ncbi:non-specific serine/threonine protein kinase [Malassezia sp. CBS 17886]|nr:non-specific serine/threonine protein kinase [Malassezia sp. CBS 17886]
MCDASAPPRARVGDYLLEQEIGKGSFAQVYRAHHRDGPRQLVAVKSVTRSKLSPKLLENLEGEISILTSMRHSNIVDLRDCIYSEEHIHLIMEYCPGGDLSQYIRRRGDVAPWAGEGNPLGETQRRLFPHPPDGGLHDDMVRSFLAQLASALRFLRGRDIVHRDIKPQNLLLQIPDEDCLASGHPREIPQIKVADFGFARSLPAASLAKTLCGSPLYMAPEILRYEKYDAKADLWSVGAVLFEMCVGKPPFRATNHVELLRRIEQSNDRIKFPDERSAQSLAKDNARRAVHGDPPRPPPHEVPAEVKTLIRGLLKRHPVERLSFDAFFHDPLLTSVPYCGRAVVKTQPHDLSDVSAGALRPSDPYLSQVPSPRLAPAHATLEPMDEGGGAEMGQTPLPPPPGRPPIPTSADRAPMSQAGARPDALPPATYPPTAADAPATAAQARARADESREYVLVDKRHGDEVVLASRLMDLPLNEPSEDVAAVPKRAPHDAKTAPKRAPEDGAAVPTWASHDAKTAPRVPPSALSRAISMAGMRLFGMANDERNGADMVPADMVWAETAAPPSKLPTCEAPSGMECVDEDMFAMLRSLAQKAYVLSKFADAKFAEVQPVPRPCGVSPAGSSPLSPAVSLQELAAAEGLALYVRTLGFLQRGLETINGYAQSLGSTAPSNEMRDMAQWFRAHFTEGYEKAMFARTCCSAQHLPESIQHVDRLIFDKALELARAAALEELEGNRDAQYGWDATGCILAYETASSLLLGLLDPSEDRIGLSVNSVSTVEKFLKSINKRLGALSRAPMPPRAAPLA